MFYVCRALYVYNELQVELVRCVRNTTYTQAIQATHSPHDLLPAQLPRYMPPGTSHGAKTRPGDRSPSVGVVESFGRIARGQHQTHNIWRTQVLS